MYVSRGTGAKGLGDDLTSKDRNVQNTNVQNAEVMVSYRGGCVGWKGMEGARRYSDVRIPLRTIWQ